MLNEMFGITGYAEEENIIEIDKIIERLAKEGLYAKFLEKFEEKYNEDYTEIYDMISEQVNEIAKEVEKEIL